MFNVFTYPFSLNFFLYPFFDLPTKKQAIMMLNV